MSNKAQHINQARILMREQHSGVLSTQSLSSSGFPFGSVTPYLMTEQGDLVIYASDIAQHSRNIKADSHVSVCVHDGVKTDSQASSRVTVLAYAQTDNISKWLKQAYFTVFPQAKKYVEAHDFRFYLLTTQRVRYIGGFGEIYWFSKEEWQAQVVSLEHQSKGIIDHMHEDHGDALAEIHNYTKGTEAEAGEVEILSCYAEGFHVQYQDKIRFIHFFKAIEHHYDVRKAMVELTKASRQQMALG
jgi:putative heme iron utilization protein